MAAKESELTTKEIDKVENLPIQMNAWTRAWDGVTQRRQFFFCIFLYFSLHARFTWLNNNAGK
jgi:hypothetical protein